MTYIKNDYEMIIRPKKGLFAIDLREMLYYRELLYFLAWREIKIRYKQTFMGASWALLQPPDMYSLTVGIRFHDQVQQALDFDILPVVFENKINPYTGEFGHVRFTPRWSIIDG